RNAQDGISVVQTAEGALTETHAILQRLRDLAVQAGNDSNNAKARANITSEAKQLTAELARIADSTNCTGSNLLDRSAGTLKFQVGANGDTASQIEVNLTTTNVKSIADALTVGGAGRTFDVLTPTDVAGAMEFTVTDASGSANTVSVDVGAAGSHTTVQS